nr:hypothetical protein [Clostridia bacterium]
MKFQFEPNDTVMYGGQGACKLLEITEREFCGDLKWYYVLRYAFSGSSVFYVPVDSQLLTSKMHLVKSAREIRDIVRSVKEIEWIEEDRPRQNHFKQLLEAGGTENIVSMFKLIARKQKELVEIGKKLRAVDERLFGEMERLLHEEFSFAFDIAKDDVLPFVLGEKELAEK